MKIQTRLHRTINSFFNSLLWKKSSPLIMGQLNSKQFWPKFVNKSIWQPGPCCSKLTMLIVNISLKLWKLNMTYMLICWLKKMWVALLLIFFCKKNPWIRFVLIRQVNILTTNELVKLRMLWKTGSCTRMSKTMKRGKQWQPRSDATGSGLDLHSFIRPVCSCRWCL